VLEHPRLALDVQRPLEDELLIGLRARPDRHRVLHGLEVKVVARVRQLGEVARRALVDSAEGGVGRFGRRWHDGRPRRPPLALLAPREEGALERAPALRPRGDDGQASGEDLLEAAHPPRQLGEQRPHLVGHRDLLEQAAVVSPAAVHEVGVDDGDVDDVERQAGAFDRPGLDRDVGQVVLLEAGRRLDLDHAHAAVAALEDVGAHEHAGVAEGRLVQDHVAGARQGGRGLAQRLAERHTLADQRAPRVQIAGHLAEVGSRGEAALHVGRVDLEPRLMDAEPQAARALQPGGDARLGEAGRSHGPDSSRRRARTHTLAPVWTRRALESRQDDAGAKSESRRDDAVVKPESRRDATGAGLTAGRPPGAAHADYDGRTR